MKQVYLHLGTHKTGTSFVQSVLNRNASKLGQDGVRVVIGAESNGFLHEVDREAVVADWLKPGTSTVVYSNENFVLAENPKRLDLLRRLRDALAGGGADVTSIFYVRPATEWIPSMWAQYVKIASRVHGDLTLDEFIEAFGYDSVIDAIAALQTEGSTIIRPYLRAAMKNESILDDFFDTIGISAEGLDSNVNQVNTTPSRRQIDHARVLNLHRPSGPVARRHHIELLDSFLRARSYRDPTPGVAATVTKAQLQRIAERYADAESHLTDGAIDSRHGLADLVDRAPEAHEPDVPADAVDQYLQNMMIMSKLESLHEQVDRVR